MIVQFRHPAPGTPSSKLQAPSSQVLNPKSQVHWVVPPYLISTGPYAEAALKSSGRDP